MRVNPDVEPAAQELLLEQIGLIPIGTEPIEIQLQMARIFQDEAPNLARRLDEALAAGYRANELATRICADHGVRLPIIAAGASCYVVMRAAGEIEAAAEARNV